MDDRPSIAATLVRVLLAAGFIVAGYEHISHQSDALHTFVIDQVLPLPPGAVRALGIVEVTCAVVLLLGIAPRLSSLVLFGVTVVSLAHVASHSDRLHLIGPAVLALVCLISIGIGGGRWALIDRLDPPRPRRLARE